MHTINQDHMIYGPWNMKCNRQNVFVILDHFCPFSPLTARKMKISKMKKNLEISSFYTIVPKILIIVFTVPKIWRMTDAIVIFILGYTFPFYFAPNSQKKKDEKTASELYIVTLDLYYLSECYLPIKLTFQHF